MMMLSAVMLAGIEDDVRASLVAATGYGPILARDKNRSALIMKTRNDNSAGGSDPKSDTTSALLS
jgi:hypothetical protein